MSRDSIADWPDIAADQHGNIHVGFHGTANSGKFGQDEAFYVRRPASGPGAWGAWDRPVPLHPMNRAAHHAQSYAPSFSLNPATDALVAVVFFDNQDQSHEAFDVDALVLRDGKMVGKPIPLSRNARAAIDANHGDDALAVWFATPAPRIYRQADG